LAAIGNLSNLIRPGLAIIHAVHTIVFINIMVVGRIGIVNAIAVDTVTIIP
jgi:hypothetical protein